MDLRRLILSLCTRKDSSDKTNYRPISILPVLSEAFERCLYDHIYEYVDTILSKVQCSVQFQKI